MARSSNVEPPMGEDTDAFAAETGRESENNDMTTNTIEDELADDRSTPAESLEEQLASAMQEVEELRDKFLRARADLENYRKRSVQYIAEGIRDGQKQTFEAILPVIDNLERAVDYQEQHQTNSMEDLLTGVRMTLWQLREALERQTVKRIDSIGQAFDPRYHEAVEIQPVEEGMDTDTVVGEIQAGYLFGDVVLRPARVRVAQRRQPYDDATETA